MRLLKETSDPSAMKKELLDGEGRMNQELLLLITPECVSMKLQGETKEEIITELVDILAIQGKLLDRDMVLHDVLEREKVMSTGMQYGIALPHAKTDGVGDMVVAVGIKKQGVEFDAVDGEKSRLFIMVVSPKKSAGPHIQFLASIGSVLNDDAIREAVINAPTVAKVISLLRNKPAGKKQEN